VVKGTGRGDVFGFFASRARARVAMKTFRGPRPLRTVDRGLLEVLDYTESNWVTEVSGGGPWDRGPITSTPWSPRRRA
jgi:hypothetical protein